MRASKAIFATALFLVSTNVADAATLSPKEVQAEFFNGQPFTSSTLSNTKFTIVVQGRRQSDAKAARHNRRRWRGDLEAFEGRLLHHVEGQQGELLHAGDGG